MNRSPLLLCSVCMCVCVWCQCPLCVFLLLFIWKQQGRNTGHFVFLCVFVAYWFDHCLSKSEWEREGGVYSTVDYRSLVRVWYSRLWLFREIQYIFMCIATQKIFHFYSLGVCVCVPSCTSLPHSLSLLPWWCGGHGDGGGRLGSGTVGRWAEINCDCDSGERRIKQQAIKGGHDLRLCAPRGDGRHIQRKLSIVQCFGCNFQDQPLAYLYKALLSALGDVCVCGIVP